MTSKIDEIVRAVVGHLGTQDATVQWAACATIWVRLWVLAGDGWSRWPDAAVRIFEGLKLALAQSGRLVTDVPEELVLLGLETIYIEDDGSPEWQYMVDLAAVLSEALGGAGPSELLESTIRTFLEGSFNVSANLIALQTGSAISQLRAEDEMNRDAAWQASVALVRSL